MRLSGSLVAPRVTPLSSLRNGKIGAIKYQCPGAVGSGPGRGTPKGDFEMQPQFTRCCLQCGAPVRALYCNVACVNRARRRPLVDRYWLKVIRPDDPDACWGWRASLHGFGYGSIREDSHIGRRWVSAHQVSWRIHFGPIPDGMAVLHSCDNPPCSNPRHLFLGTKLDNTRDMFAKGRAWTQTHPGMAVRGERNGTSKLTEAQVMDILRRFSAGGVSCAALARDNKVTPRVVQMIVCGESWAHVSRAMGITMQDRKRRANRAS